LYRPEVKNQVYARMLLEAQRSLERGESVILDATYSKRNRRDEVLRLAADQGVNCLFLETACSRRTMERRLKQRDRERPDSKARAGHLDEFLKSFEPMEELGGLTLLRIDTEGNPGESLHRAVTGAHTLRLAQVRAHVKERLFEPD
jgi:hypothetical protein